MVRHYTPQSLFTFTTRTARDMHEFNKTHSTKNGYKLKPSRCCVGVRHPKHLFDTEHVGAKEIKSEPGCRVFKARLILKLWIVKPRNSKLEEISTPGIVIGLNSPFGFPSPTNNNTEDNSNPKWSYECNKVSQDIHNNNRGILEQHVIVLLLFLGGTEWIRVNTQRLLLLLEVWKNWNQWNGNRGKE